MNKKLRKLIIIGICAALTAMSALAASASSSLLSPGTSRITAGSSFDFTLDLSSVIEKAGESEDGALNEFVAALTVSPAISSLKVSEGVGSVNVVSGEYQVTSSKLGKHSSLHFTVTPAGDITKDTTYTVSVNVSGSVKASDSFTFIVEAVKTEKPDDPKGGENGKENEKKQGFKMPGKKSSGGSVPSGGGGGGSGSASTVYAGSWDNYLDSLSVDGFEFTRKFNKIRDTYFMTVPLDTTELTVNATASDSSAIVAVSGNTDLPEGRSKIMVNVTADDGSVRIYRIYVDRTDEKEEEKSEEDSKSGKPGLPEGFELPDGASLPEGFTPPDGSEMPEGFTPPGGSAKPDSNEGKTQGKTNNKNDTKEKNSQKTDNTVNSTGKNKENGNEGKQEI